MRRQGLIAFTLLFLSFYSAGYCQDTPLGPPIPLPVAAPPLVLRFHDLNPAFLLSPQQIDAAIARGQSLAKNGKPFQEVVKDNQQMPQGVKGEKGKSHESRVTCLSLNAITFAIQAYNATNKYEPLPPSQPGGLFTRAVTFDVLLNSVPKVKTRRFERERRANADDVQVDKFVLTDDKGNVYNSQGSSSAGVQSGMDDFSGISRIYHQETSQVNANSSASIYGNHGGYINGSGTTNGTVTTDWYETIPWSESHPYYSARYTVRFPLFDKDGQPLIRADAKSMTLHIITPNGEKDATFELRPSRVGN